MAHFFGYVLNIIFVRGTSHVLIYIYNVRTYQKVAVSLLALDNVNTHVQHYQSYITSFSRPLVYCSIKLTQCDLYVD